MDSESKIKYLEMIQGVINRLANNSFMLKGWAVTLVAGIFVLASKDTDKLYLLVAFIPAIFFWFLDSYYLRQERLYRSLYEKVITDDKGVTTFSLKAKKEDFDNKKNGYLRCVMSITEIWFYIPLIAVCGMLIALTHCF